MGVGLIRNVSDVSNDGTTQQELLAASKPFVFATNEQKGEKMLSLHSSTVKGLFQSLPCA